MSSPAVDRVIGPYRLVRRLGAGGMGEVFLAHDSRLDRQVAIKHAHPQRSSPEQRARFRREAWAAARLSHPAIVPVFDILSDEDGDWIVMEFVDGPSLHDHLEAHGRPPLATTVAWAAQLAEGLAAAHEKGILHRDLKTENVLVSPSGHLKIADFGLAKPMFADDPNLAVSKTGAVLGTPRAMAPEQARGHCLDPRADLFSFGVLLYELLTGVSPFAADTPLDTFARLAIRPHDPVTLHNPAIPPRLSALLDALLAKSPDERPASAAAVAEELRGISFELSSEEHRAAAAARDVPTVISLPGAPLGAGPPAPSWAAVLTREHGPAAPAGRRRWWIGSLALLAVLGAGAAIVARTWVSEGRDTTLAAEAADDDPYALYQAGMARLARWDKPGHIEAAIGLFQRALRLEPRSAPALAGLSRAYWRQSRVTSRDEQLLRQARAVAEQAVAVDNHLAAAHISLGWAAVDQGDLDVAIAAFARAEVLEPANADAARGRGAVALARGDNATAVAAFREAILRRKGDAELHNALGSVLFQQKSYAEAEAEFRRAIALAPDAVAGHRNLSAVLQARGDDAGAAAELQRAIEIAPDPTLYTNLGTLLFYQGRYAEANAAYERAVTAAGEREGTATNNPLLWANLGDSYRFLPGHEDDARLAFRRAALLVQKRLAGSASDETERSRLALYLAKTGDGKAARKEIALVSAGAIDLASRYRLVLAHEALGDRPAALAALADALDAGLSIAEVEREPELALLRADPSYHRLAALTAPR